MKDINRYRGDRSLFKEAKVQAAREGRPVGQFVDDAIKEKLERVRNIEDKH